MSLVFLLQAKEKGREPTNFEIYEHVHKHRGEDRRDAGEYVDGKSKRVCVSCYLNINNEIIS